MRGANGRFDCSLIPGLPDTVSHSIDIPGIAAAKIAPALAYDLIAGSGRPWSRRVAGWNIRVAALAGDVVFLCGSLIFKRASFARGRERFFLVKLGNFRGVGLWLRRLRLWVFLMKAIGGIDRFAFGDHFFRGHGDARIADEIHFYAAELTSDAAPTRALAVKISSP